MKKYVPTGAIPVVLFAALLLGTMTRIASAQTVPSPWTARDVGTPVLAGSATYASGVFTVSGAGANIWGTADQFMFVYQRITGDVDIRAKVEDLDGSSGYAKAGVMIRASLNANAAHAFSHVTVGAGVRAVRRLTTGAISLGKSGTSTGAPKWLRAVRKGATVTTYWSSTGSSWTAISTDTIALGSSTYVGIAVNSRSTGARATGRFSSVKIIGGPALPAGQQSADIGSPAIAGSAAYLSGTYTIRAAGTHIWDRSDQFRYTYQTVTGNVDMVARVASITYADAWSKAGLMIRESLAANARHATTFVSAGKGYAFHRRSDPGVYSEHTSGGSGTAPGWVRLVRTGDTFESYRSSNGSTWTRIGTDVIPMGDTVYVGIAVTSTNAAQATTAVVDNFRLTAAAANRAPAVSITSPASGVQVTAPATVSITATASDPENRMMSVDFYVGSTLVLRDTTAPYAASWSASTAGTYSLTAVAHDADGGSSRSSAVSLTVSSSTTTTAPTKVAFMKSVDHATKVTNYVLKVYASGVNVSTTTPLATSDLGKPTPSSTGEIVVDRASFFSALASGRSYQAAVTAVGSGGQTQSAAVSFTR